MSSMLWHITKREVQDHFTSLRFALTIGLVTLLMVLNGLVFVNSDYRQRTSDYLVNVAKVEEKLRASCQHLNDLAEKGPVAIYKRPSALVFCANDREDILPVSVHAESYDFHGTSFTNNKRSYSYDYRNPWRLQYVQNIPQKNSVLQPFIGLDWAFIIGLVMSFVAILFTFDAISAERQRGTLALMLSNPVSRGIVLLGKFLGAFLIIIIPLLMGMLLSLLIVALSGLVPFDENDWTRVGLMAAVSLIYIAVFIGLGLAISSHMQHSSTSLLVLLLLWVIFVVLASNTLGSVVSILHKVPSQIEFQQQKEATMKALGQMSDAFKYGSPTAPDRSRKTLENWADYITSRWKTQTRLDDDRLDTQFAQVQFARQILRVSPVTIYNYAMEALAETGFQRHKQFIEAARRYREQFITFIKERDRADPESSHVYYVKEGLSKKPVSFDNVPKFREPTGVGVAFRSALMDMSLLILMAGLCFMASYLAFLKCVVKCEAEDMAYHYPVPVDSEQPVDQERIVSSGEMYPLRTKFAKRLC